MLLNKNVLAQNRWWSYKQLLLYHSAFLPFCSWLQLGSIVVKLVQSITSLEIKNAKEGMSCSSKKSSFVCSPHKFQSLQNIADMAEKLIYAFPSLSKIFCQMLARERDVMMHWKNKSGLKSRGEAVFFSSSSFWFFLGWDAAVYGSEKLAV